MENKIFRGVRNILEGEPDDWLGREAVHRGLGTIIIIIIIIIVITSRTKGLIIIIRFLIVSIKKWLNMIGCEQPLLVA